jgi:hypothetical protein
MNQYSGGNFDDFLAEEGILDAITARAYKRLLALQVQDAMTEAQVSKSELAGVSSQFVGATPSTALRAGSCGRPRGQAQGHAPTP